MKFRSVSALIVTCAAAGLAACDSASPTSQLVSDAVVVNDVASSSGEAIGSALDAMRLDESSTSLPGARASLEASPDFTYARTVKCYNADGVQVNGCNPLSSVRKIVSHVEFGGSRSGSREVAGGKTTTWSGAVHRIADDTLVRNYNAAQTEEISRTHSNLLTSHDTTTFSDGTNSRFMAEAARDTVKALTWNLPHASNPWPVSGSIVRTDTTHIEATDGTNSRSRTAVWRVEVDFPADAQGNVVLKVNDKTCQLNLVTRKVTNCQ